MRFKKISFYFSTTFLPVKYISQELKLVVLDISPCANKSFQGKKYFFSDFSKFTHFTIDYNFSAKRRIFHLFHDLR